MAGKERRALLSGAPGAVRGAVSQALQNDGWTVCSIAEHDGDPSLSAEPVGALVIIVGSANIDAAGRFGPSIGATIEHIETVIAQARARMADAGGAVVVVSPPLGSEAEGGVTATAVMQRALTGLVRGLALELGDSAIRANVVLPGVLRESAACLPGVIPLIRDDTGDRRGSAEDVANAVTYLVSEDSSYITGIELVVDGGLSQCRSSGTFALWDAGVIDAFTPPSPLGA